MTHKLSNIPHILTENDLVVFKCIKNGLSTISTIMKETSLSKMTAIKSINRLVKAGFLVVEKHKPLDKLPFNVYIIIKEPTENDITYDIKSNSSVSKDKSTRYSRHKQTAHAEIVTVTTSKKTKYKINHNN